MPLSGKARIEVYLPDVPRQAYQDLLGRPADEGGLSFWSGLVENGTSRVEVVQQLTGRAEYQARLRRPTRRHRPQDLRVACDDRQRISVTSFANRVDREDK